MNEHCNNNFRVVRRAVVSAVAVVLVSSSLVSGIPADAAPRPKDGGSRTWVPPYEGGASGDLVAAAGPASAAVMFLRPGSPSRAAVSVVDRVGTGRSSVTYTAAVSVAKATAIRDGRVLLVSLLVSVPSACWAWSAGQTRQQCQVSDTPVVLAGDEHPTSTQATLVFALELVPSSVLTSLPAGEYRIGVELVAEVRHSVGGQMAIPVPCPPPGMCTMPAHVSGGVGTAEGAVHVAKITR